MEEIKKFWDSLDGLLLVRKRELALGGALCVMTGLCAGHRRKAGGRGHQKEAPSARPPLIPNAKSAEEYRPAGRQGG